MTVAELRDTLRTFPADALVYVGTENHTEALIAVSVFASGAVSLDGDPEENYCLRIPPGRRARPAGGSL